MSKIADLAFCYKCVVSHLWRGKPMYYSCSYCQDTRRDAIPWSEL